MKATHADNVEQARELAYPGAVVHACLCRCLSSGEPDDTAACAVVRTPGERGILTLTEEEVECVDCLGLVELRRRFEARKRTGASS